MIIKKIKYYVSSDFKLFLSDISKNKYEETLSQNDMPLEVLRKTNYSLNNFSCYLYIAEGKEISYENGELDVYGAGPIWNGVMFIEYFYNIEDAKKYMYSSQKVDDNYERYLKSLLPDNKSGYTITQAYKDELKNKGWKLWKDEKPPVGEVIIFSKGYADILACAITRQYFDGKRTDNRLIPASKFVAWMPVPGNWPINPSEYFKVFCKENNLILKKLVGYRKYHFEKDSIGCTHIKYDEIGIEETMEVDDL